MDKKTLLQKVANLESMNDQLLSELDYLDSISRQLGFCEGLKTLKEAAIELLEIEQEKELSSEDEAS